MNYETIKLAFVLRKGSWRAWIARPLLGFVWWLLQPEHTERGQERGRKALRHFYEHGTWPR